MYKISIEDWPVKGPNGEEGKENLLVLMGYLVSQNKEVPTGFAAFQLFNKIVKAFEKADTTKVLELEEPVYKFLKNIVEKNIPSNWSGNPAIYKAVVSFMEAKDE